MVVEFLTLEVTPDDGDLGAWLDTDEAHWTAFLARQPGFVRKEVWRSHGTPPRVSIVIWWESLAAWHAVPGGALAHVSAAMGDHEIPVTCVAHEVLRAR